MSALDVLKQRISSGSAVVGIYGLGYVGLPLALRFSEVGIKVVGFDIDESKVTRLNNGKSYIERLQAQEIIAAQQNGFEATSDFSRTKEVDALIICVPTPLNVYREPDLSYVENTLASILPYFKAG